MQCWPCYFLSSSNSESYGTTKTCAKLTAVPLWGGLVSRALVLSAAADAALAQRCRHCCHSFQQMWYSSLYALACTRTPNHKGVLRPINVFLTARDRLIPGKVPAILSSVHSFRQHLPIILAKESKPKEISYAQTASVSTTHGHRL